MSDVTVAHKDSPIVASSISRIGLSVHHSVFLEGLWISRLASVVDLVRAMWMTRPTTPMKHAAGDGGPKARLCNRIRQIGADQFVDSVSMTWSARSVKDEEDVGMGQPPLLVVHNPCVTDHFAKDSTTTQVIQQSHKLAVEDTRHKVRSIMHGLARG